MTRFVIEHRWNDDLSVVSHTLIVAPSRYEAQRKADKYHPEHRNRVLFPYDRKDETNDQILSKGEEAHGNP